MYQRWIKKFEEAKKENCKYCMEDNEAEIYGKYFELKPTAGFKRDRKYSSWIMKGKTDKTAGIIIATNNTNGVYFDINYCPMCGRKLKKEDKQ